MAKNKTTKQYEALVKILKYFVMTPNREITPTNLMKATNNTDEDNILSKGAYDKAIKKLFYLGIIENGTQGSWRLGDVLKFELPISYDKIRTLISVIEHEEENAAIRIVQKIANFPMLISDPISYQALSTSLSGVMIEMYNELNHGSFVSTLITLSKFKTPFKISVQLGDSLLSMTNVVVNEIRIGDSIEIATDKLNIPINDFNDIKSISLHADLDTLKESIEKTMELLSKDNKEALQEFEYSLAPLQMIFAI